MLTQNQVPCLPPRSDGRKFWAWKLTKGREEKATHNVQEDVQGKSSKNRSYSIKKHVAWLESPQAVVFTRRRTCSTGSLLILCWVWLCLMSFIIPMSSHSPWWGWGSGSGSRTEGGQAYRGPHPQQCGDGPPGPFLS